MILEDIITNARIACKQNDIEFNDFLIGCVMKELTHKTPTQEDTERFYKYLEYEYDLIWEIEPTLEEDHALAVQHARDIYDVLLGRF